MHKLICVTAHRISSRTSALYPKKLRSTNKIKELICHKTIALN